MRVFCLVFFYCWHVCSSSPVHAHASPNVCVCVDFNSFRVPVVYYVWMCVYVYIIHIVGVRIVLRPVRSLIVRQVFGMPGHTSDLMIGWKVWIKPTHRNISIWWANWALEIKHERLND